MLRIQNPIPAPQPVLRVFLCSELWSTRGHFVCPHTHVEFVNVHFDEYRPVVAHCGCPIIRICSWVHTGVRSPWVHNKCNVHVFTQRSSAVPTMTIITRWLLVRRACVHVCVCVCVFVCRHCCEQTCIGDSLRQWACRCVRIKE